MPQENQTKSKQVDNAQKPKDGAVSSSDNNNTDTDTDTDPPNGRRIEEINKENPLKKLPKDSNIQGGPDSDPPNS